MQTLSIFFRCPWSPLKPLTYNTILLYRSNMPQIHCLDKDLFIISQNMAQKVIKLHRPTTIIPVTLRVSVEGLLHKVCLLDKLHKPISCSVKTLHHNKLSDDTIAVMSGFVQIYYCNRLQLQVGDISVLRGDQHPNQLFALALV